MRSPRGEHVSLDFYFGDRRCADGMRDIVAYCLANGGLFTGEVVEIRGIGVRSAANTTNRDRSVSVQNLGEEELLRRLDDDNNRVVQVGLRQATGLAKGFPEIVTFNSISHDALSHDTNPISMAAEWRFSAPGHEKEATQEAHRCYRRFLAICNALEPDYAAILNENSLPCRFDLRNGREDECFGNFFIGVRRYGAQVLDTIQSKYADAYTERSSSGLYVATWLFAPVGAHVDSVSVRKRSKEVAKLISR